MTSTLTHGAKSLDEEEILVRRYAGLAQKLANQATTNQREAEDVRQIAMVGLFLAARRFDPSRGLEFSTFAWATISGELKRFKRDTGWAVRMPRSLQEGFLRARDAVDELTQRNGRAPTPAELADAIGATADGVRRAMAAGDARQAASVESEAAVDGRVVAVEGPDRVVEARITAHAVLERLSERERRLLEMRFFEDLTQAEIGERLGISQMHVSRLLRSALAHAREIALLGPDEHADQRR